MNATVAVTRDQVVQGDLKLKIKSVLLCREPSSSSTDTPDGCRTIYKVRSSFMDLQSVLPLSWYSSSCVVLFACISIVSVRVYIRTCVRLWCFGSDSRLAHTSLLLHCTVWCYAMYCCPCRVTAPMQAGICLSMPSADSTHPSPSRLRTFKW